MLQLSNFDRVMETETISKNGASPKSQMSRGKIMQRAFLFFIAFFVSVTSAFAQGVIRYVKTTTTGTGDGSSWANAAADIQSMINASAVGDQVWIAGGTYLIATTLLMKNGINVYGGFQGSESNINARSKSDLDANGTIDAWEFTNATILDGQNATRVLSYAGNSFNMETTWDGVTITKGYADKGAGAYIIANGKLNNCIVTQNNNRNSFAVYGGGIYNNGGMVNNCIVYRNTIGTSYFGGRVIHNLTAQGAGIYNTGTVSNCMIFDNYCDCRADGSSTAAADGGGIYNYGGFVNTCCIYNNSIYAISSGTVSTYLGAGGIHNSTIPSSKKVAYVYCSTILNNGENNIYNYYGDYALANNCIVENSDLEQNFIRPTSFVGQANDDAQRAELLRASWRLKQGSQYVETGSLTNLPDWIINGTDLAANPRVSNGKISVGAYEFDPTVNVIKLTHLDNGIKIYPNPVINSFIVDYEGFIQVKIYDMLGKEILSQDTNGKTEMNINHLPKGIYNVSIISEGKVIGNSKIMKQ